MQKIMEEYGMAVIYLIMGMMLVMLLSNLLMVVSAY